VLVVVHVSCVECKLLVVSTFAKREKEEWEEMLVGHNDPLPCQI
jgi:hypothetical protein